ncbi:pyridine nucleotide-disulfide oxidoreductase [Candidatus Thiomargarita nelsonii]|uniref:Pyridine nucleotide-disulfide oxidoreductase n=1 Tax=Candidatus Thiomargarita nelsonii TaxID=1003181 RepID=A0A4E0QLW8_9GAMM|nr:pyridine nucleotide-disulfide oxidoreductase [Candidatus Thiomargarita nelsonii]
MPQIVIIGSGFGGLTAVRTLRKQGCRDPITLISPRPVLFYYASLIWVPAGLRSEEDLTVPLDKFFKRHNVKYHQGSVTGLDDRQVQTDNGTIAFDSLIIASGGRFIKKLPGIEHIYTPCEGYAPTKAYSDRLAALEGGTLAFGFASNPKEPVAMRGGPIFEFMFGIDTLLRQQKRRDKFELVFFSPAAEPGKRLGGKAVKALLGEMQKYNIRSHLGHKMKGFSADAVHTEGGDIASDLTLFMPGMMGPAWAENSGLPLSEGGFFQADAYCRVPGFKGIYAVGDAGSHAGPEWLPKQAHMADLQAEAAAKNLLAEQQGQEPQHQFKTELICIIDTLNKGMLIYRDSKRAILMPKLRFFNWAKRLFEWLYLRPYR